MVVPSMNPMQPGNPSRVNTSLISCCCCSSGQHIHLCLTDIIAVMTHSMYLLMVPVARPVRTCLLIRDEPLPAPPKRARVTAICHARASCLQVERFWKTQCPSSCPTRAANPHLIILKVDLNSLSVSHLNFWQKKWSSCPCKVHSLTKQENVTKSCSLTSSSTVLSSESLKALTIMSSRLRMRFLHSEVKGMGEGRVSGYRREWKWMKSGHSCFLIFQ